MRECEREGKRGCVCGLHIRERENSKRDCLSVRETAIHGKRRERKKNWVCFYEREGERGKDRE